MNRHLNDQAKQSPPPALAHPSLGALGPQRRASWRTWLFVVGLAFGLYVFGGDFVLKPEYQWSTISGRIGGKTGASATREITDAEAAKAGAVSKATEEAKIDPQLQTAAGLAVIEVGKAKAIASLEVQKQAQLNALEVAKGPASAAASAYQQCLANARYAAQSSGDTADTTFGARVVAREMAYARNATACEPLRTQEDAAAEAATQAVEWSPERQTQEE